MAILGASPLDLENTAGIGHIFDSNTGMSISSGTGRSGGNSLHSISNSISVTKNIGSNQTTFNFAFGWQPASLAVPNVNGLLLFTDAGTTQVSIRPNSDGSISAYRSNTTLLGTSAVGVISAATYQHIEVSVTIDATVGAVQIWVNSVSVLNLTNVNTKQTANTTISGFSIVTPWSAIHDWCDIVWSTTRINDVRVETLVPTGAGNYSQFTPSTGSNWQNVDEVPPNDDTDFNSTSTVGNIDSFTHAALSGAPVSISAVIVNVRARDTTTGAASLAPFIRSSTTDSPGTAVTLNTSYQDFQSVYLTDPATSAAWLPAAVNAAEFGYKRIT